MFANVTPQRDTFFGLLTSHADRLVAGANATLRLMTGLGTPSAASRDALIDEVNVDETSADRIKADYIRLLYESFTTPINRDQMHRLMLDLDRVLDGLQSTANAVKMYNIPASTPAARALASLASDACIRLHRAVAALEERRAAALVVALCREIDDIEARGRRTMRAAVSALFAVEGDEAAVWHALKMRRLYFTQMGVLDACRRCSKTVEEILIDNA